MLSTPRKLASDRGNFSISNFPRDGKFWRIDWFGDIGFPNRTVRWKQPSVMLSLSRVLNDNQIDDPASFLTGNIRLPANSQRRVWVSAGILPLIRIGDIWRDGKLQAEPQYQLESFTNVRIDHATVKLVKAGLNLNEEGFLLPLAEHPWHINHTQSYCLVVSLPDTRRLIIPCLELIRFYFGSSGSLIAQLFQPPLERCALYSKPNFNPSNRRLTLTLSPKITGYSASDIGRLHLDPAAWRAAARIGASILKAAAQRTMIYPQTYFPFTGETNLIAAGKWLSFGDRPNQSFVVFNLRSCSHPFPFDTLAYEMTRPHKLTPSGASPKRLSVPASNFCQISDEQRLVDKDPSKYLAPLRSRVVWHGVKFPDLDAKPVFRRSSLIANESPATRFQGSAARINEMAVGEPTGTKRRVRPIELITANNPGAMAFDTAPAFLQEAIKELGSIPEISVTLLTESNDDGWTIPIAALLDKQSEVDSRLFIAHGSLPVKLRRISVFAITHGKHEGLLVMIESTPLHVRLYSSRGSTTDDLSDTVKEATSDFLLTPHRRKRRIRSILTKLAL